MDNLIISENNEFVSPELDLSKITVNSSENYPKCIICRKNLILFFLHKTQIVITFQFDEENSEPKIKIANIELLSHKLNEFSHIDIDDDLSKMILINGEIDEKYGLKQNNDLLGDNNSENNIFLLN